MRRINKPIFLVDETGEAAAVVLDIASYEILVRLLENEHDEDFVSGYDTMIREEIDSHQAERDEIDEGVRTDTGVDAMSLDAAQDAICGILSYGAAQHYADAVNRGDLADDGLVRDVLERTGMV